MFLVELGLVVVLATLLILVFDVFLAILVVVKLDALVATPTVSKDLPVVLILV